MLTGKRILLIIGGGIAAYKTLDLIRRLRRSGAAVTPVLSRAGAEFVTPLSVSALAGEKVHDDLWDLTDEAEMGHIQLSRVADLIVVAPATADLMAKMAQGRADDLASTLLLATDTPILIAPAMNVRMWQHPATQRNLGMLKGDGVRTVGPEVGDMACGEQGPGRMSEPADIMAAIEAQLGGGPLSGRHVLVTSGPTHEPIDPVRYIANRSSGAQGAAIARAARDAGARVSFVTGPASVPPPEGVDVIRVETAREMREAVLAALPADVAIFVAAVADWRVATPSDRKMKKSGGALPVLDFAENPDILAEVSRHDQRPTLVIGFAAETHDVADHARAKRERKGCDWILANDVSDGTGIMGGAENAVTFISAEGAEEWPRAGKDAVATRLIERIAAKLAGEL
ncbi:Phosphopantothenate-cysteine ligase [Palleronia marisminoris]|uniref:Coenzyme A biosynthesis bifunctional protein CoaBC n=1 Tax=Palleronia marisminoris TaxID=315423 RepID=A0A1Y5RW20_9RHOB|nr:bifunctional phosphopantothenoylcysteine decarboxylase/phosphopantothenate--cysteine ligase CoaBC [Palleronia marisminoris]SFG47766.1 Phosphopantothenate-cysteine ligase [Palleronia marisminoris]SLN25447.1 Coenzyme A biosynthesis bifunctional protein CoaBC [Palleronia marisminoris]